MKQKILKGKVLAFNMFKKYVSLIYVLAEFGSRESTKDENFFYNCYLANAHALCEQIAHTGKECNRPTR